MMEELRVAANRELDQMWTRAASTVRAANFALIAVVLAVAAGASLVLIGVASIYPPAAFILAGLGLMYLAFVLSTHVES